MPYIHTLRLPHPGYLRRVALRSALMWLGAKGILFLVLYPSSGLAAALQPTLGIPAVLVWLDRRRARELLLHANLGAEEAWIWAASLLMALALDAAATALLLAIGGALGADLRG
jgi:hypothetical protein